MTNYYIHKKHGMLTLEKLFKRKLVTSLHRTVVDGKAQFHIYQSYKRKRNGIHLIGWRITDRDELLKAIDLAEKNNIEMVRED